MQEFRYACIFLILGIIQGFKYMSPNNRIVTSTFTELSSSYREVFDDVVSKQNLLKIDDIARISGLGHTLYDRKLVDKPRSSIESIIESILVNIQDKTRYVEYWWRDEWINLEAHADVDEILAKTDSSATLRYPVHGHVLYLQIGDQVRGPTLLFLNNFTFFIAVPAVEGRLLRFKGDIVHAVPRPPLAYLDSEQGGTNHELWMRIKRVDGQVSDETTINRRSVLLFNTWEEAPMDIKDMPDDVVLNCQYNKQEASHNDSVVECTCNPYNEWIIQSEHIDDDIISPHETATVPSPSVRIKLGLLGDKLRRGRSDRYLELQASSIANVKQALLSSARVSRVGIQEKKK